MTSTADQFEEGWARIRAGAALSDAIDGPKPLDSSVVEVLATAAALSRAGLELVPQVDRMWRAVAAHIEDPRTSGQRARARRRPGRARMTALMVAAAMLLCGVVLLASRHLPIPYHSAAASGSVATQSAARLARAETTLSDLARAARQGRNEEVLSRATELARLRREESVAGADVSSLDRLIRQTLSTAVPYLPSDVVGRLRVILGDLTPVPQGSTNEPSNVGRQPGQRRSSPGSGRKGQHPLPTPSVPSLPQLPKR